MRNHKDRGEGSDYFWTDELREEIVLRYLAGEPLTSIAEDRNIGKAVIYKAKSRKWFEEIRQNIIRQGAIACGYAVPRMT